MSRIRFILLPSMVLLVAAGVSPAAAQQQVVIRRSAAPAEGDSSARRLQRQLDSLTQRYNQGEELTQNDRHRLEVELGRVITQLRSFSRMSEDMAPRVMLRTLPYVTLPSPRGWIGIVVEGAGLEPRLEQGELVVRYLSYPRIVSVDPSSPAQAAGIVPNDTLLAYDGRDVRDNDINLNRLLVPSAKVKVRLRRDGKVREVPVVIAEAPPRIAQRRTDEVRDERTFVITPSPDGRFPNVIVDGQSAGGGRGSPRVGTPMPSLAPFSFYPNAVAGALLAPVSEGLGKKLGVSTGVLIVTVPVGSPFSESGFEEGDVLIKVGDVVVRAVRDVSRAVALANGNGQKSVDVVLMRDNKTMTKTLRW